ncbi:hypothetical protein AQ928_01190 [Burkholderia pseudomallei]|nr:hypothetical protein AQ928_01190 [Burkholderia pseudomallei]
MTRARALAGAGDRRAGRRAPRNGLEHCRAAHVRAARASPLASVARVARGWGAARANAED